MSYAIIRNAKYKRENLKGIFRHNERRNKNYSNKNLTSYQMAEYLGLSISYMRTVFKEETGKPVNQYLSEVRLKNVCHLLINSNETIENIAQTSGYLDSKNLRRAFKQTYGITPSEYRCMHTA